MRPLYLPAIFSALSRKQRGVALMVMLVIMVMGAATILVSSLNSSTIQIGRQETTSAVLAQAKDALIGRAVNDGNRPGSLPCPDGDNDGDSDLLSGNICPTYLGRLPWKTLGLPDLRDGSGERLWYALSPNFTNSNFLSNGSSPPLRVINSDTRGQFTITGNNPASNIVASIFSSGAVIGSQQRDGANPSAAINNAPSNFLENENADGGMTYTTTFLRGQDTVGDVTYTTAAASSTFNDQLIFITTRSLMPLVEQRVAGEVKQALTNYYTVNGYYPWADSVAAAVDYNANDGYNRGWLPNSAAAGSAAEWSGIARPPQWFFDNEWYTLIYYSVAKNFTRSPVSCNSPFCTENTLSVDYPTNTGVRVLFFMPGTFNSTLQRSATTLSDYLEDPENKDEANDRYATPTSQAGDRDRLYWLSSSSIWNR